MSGAHKPFVTAGSRLSTSTMWTMKELWACSSSLVHRSLRAANESPTHRPRFSMVTVPKPPVRQHRAPM